MKYFIFLLLISFNAVGQDYIRVLHGSTLWMVKSDATDSFQVSGGDKSGYSIIGHYHAISKIIGLQAALDAKGTSSFDGTWTSLSGKPSTFTPSSHNHVKADITDFGSPLYSIDTINISSFYLKVRAGLGTLATQSGTFSDKVNISDTLDMLANYKAAMIANTASILLKVNISDTSGKWAALVHNHTTSSLGLGNVTNESKATMFTNSTFTGTFNVADGSIASVDLANGAVSNLSGTNTGDNATNSQYSSLVTNANHTGDATGSTALTVVKINGTLMSGLGTGILKNTTGTGVPSIAVAGDFPTLNQNTSGTAAGLSAVLSYANGGISASAATSATTGTMTVNMITSNVTITPTGNCTFNASGGVAGQVLTFSITTSGVSSFTLTWGTNFRKTGTLATGTTSARFFTVSFICLDGTTWSEISRTAVQS